MARLIPWMCRQLALLGLLLGLSSQALAQVENLLIQWQRGGSFRVWLGNGPSVLSDDEVLLLDSLAKTEASTPVATQLGMARARRSEQGVIIELLERDADASLLVDPDACGHLKTWHDSGPAALSEDQITELYMSALPGGGPRVVLDEQRHAKAFLTSLGVMVTIWRPVRRPR